MPTDSMYTKLLDAALREPTGADDSAAEANTDDLLAEVLRRRRQMRASQPAPAGSGWAAGAVADQVAYDAALIRLARMLGIGCDVGRFATPEHERSTLEARLAERGFRLDALEGEGELIPWPTAEAPER